MITNESLNQSRHGARMAGNPNLAVPRRRRESTRSFVYSDPMDKLEEGRSPEGQLKEEVPPERCPRKDLEILI